MYRHKKVLGLSELRASLIFYLGENGFLHIPDERFSDMLPCALSERKIASVSRALQINHTSLEGMVNDLEEQGIVKRRVHPANKKNKYLELTDAGVERYLALARTACFNL